MSGDGSKSARRRIGQGQSVRWGIIGCGDVVERKGGLSFQTVSRSALVAVMRRTESKVKEYAEKHGVSFWTTDAQAVIDHPGVDAVYIATPPDHHLEYALRVCQAGKPCLVEKPVGRSAAESGRMAGAFRDKGVPFFASYYRCYLPKYERAKEILDAGQLGPIVAINYRYSRGGADKGWRTSPAVCGGGLFFDLGCHVLDLLDFWFGPLTFLGGGAVNASPAHDAEDAVSVSFRVPAGAVGTALWNFAGTRHIEVLEIEGLWGKLRLGCMDPWSPVFLEVKGEWGGRDLMSRSQRLVRKLKGKKKMPKWVRTEHSFDAIPFVHKPMIQSIVDSILDAKESRISGDRAVRTSRLMDKALSDYYSGRHGSFWERPQTWHSLRSASLRRADETAKAGGYPLSDEQLRFFDENGYLGPFRCEAPGWERIQVPENDRLNLHLEDPQLLELCSHPCIVDRVAQLFGQKGVSLMKTRIWAKSKQSAAVVPWHQDVGLNNGGIRDDGSPVPTVGVRLSIDGATRQSGAVQAIPGSHRQLLGNWKMGIQADLEETGVLKQVDMSTGVYLETQPGEFYIFHSWILHGSKRNASDSRRTGLNMRFAMRGDEFEPEFEYVPVVSPLEGSAAAAG